MTGDGDNNDGDGATGNKVGDVGNSATGDKVDNDCDGARGYNDDDNGDGLCRQRRQRRQGHQRRRLTTSDEGNYRNRDNGKDVCALTATTPAYR